MPVELPDKPIAATLFTPKVLLLYGMPKIGKTELLVNLSATDNLILQGDPRGTEPYTCLWFQLTNYNDWQDTIAAIIKKGEERYAAGERDKIKLYPYRYISIDNVTEIQEIARASLTAEYLTEAKKAGAAGTDTQKAALREKGWVITDLAYAAGTQLLRTRVKKMIEDMASVCHKLIIVAHVKDKEVPLMNNTVIKVNEIALDGKLGEIVASRVDAIGYLYRNKEGKMRVSFISNERSSMGARFKYLAGKDFEFNWETILPDEFGLSVPVV